MKIEGVEDGMGDEQAVRQVYEDAYSRHPIGEGEMWRIKDEPGGLKMLGRGYTEAGAWADARAKLPAAVPVAIPSAPATTEVRGKASPEMEELMGKLRELGPKVTQGHWSLPHMADDATKCNCGYVLSEGYMGCIATVEVDNGKPVGDEGGNDCPPLEEAKANAAWIAAASPENILKLLDHIEGKG